MELRLEQVDRRHIIANCWIKVRHHFRGVPLWVFVRDICAVGSGSAIQICRECGWDPHATHTHRLEINYRNPTPTQPAVRADQPK